MLELYNEQAEKIVLGSLLVGTKKIDLLILEIKPEYFYFAKNQLVFEAILKLFREGIPIDIVTLAEKLSSVNKLEYVGGVTYLAELTLAHINISGSLTHAKVIKEKYRMRSTINCLVENADNAKGGTFENADEFISCISTKILAISSDNVKENTEISDSLDAFSEMQTEYAENKLSGKETIGTPSGFSNLDRIIDGCRKEHFITVAAEPSIGKSTFAINLAYNLLKQGKRVVIFSLEMSKNDMISKFMGIYMDASPLAIMKCYTDEALYAKQKLAKAWLSMQKLTMYSDLDDVDEISTRMRVEEMREHVDLFILDYLQNITSTKSRDEYSLLTNGVKLLQKTNRTLGTTFVCLSQVSNDTRKSSATLTVDGKGTGAIRAASNIFIYMKRNVEKEEEVNQIIQEGRDMPLLFVVNKNRHGSIGAFRLNMTLKSGIMYAPM